MEDTQHIGRIIRNRRQWKRLSLRKTAELCGISDKGLAKIELGQTSPKWKTVLALAKALELNLGDFQSCLPTTIDDRLAG